MITPRELFKLALDSDSWFESKLELNKLRDLSYDLIHSYYFDFKNEIRKYQIEEADRRNKERLKDYYFASIFDKNKEGWIPRKSSALLDMLNKGLISYRGNPFEEIDPVEVYNNFTDFEEVHISILIDNIEEALWVMVEEAHNKEIPFDTNSDTSAELSPEWWERCPELDTDQARNYFSKAEELGFINFEENIPRWIGGKKELALFAELMSEKLKLNSKWKIFQELFNVKYLAQEKRKAVDEIGKFGNREKEIRSIFEN